MPEYIECETLISALESKFEDNENCRLFVSEIPTADVVEVKHGKLIIDEEEIGLYSCSICGYKILRAKCNYCPDCGAKMDGKDGNK